MNKLIMIAAAFLFLSACKGEDDAYDASGTFEAVETIVSSEASGAIKALNIEEGQELQAGAVVGYIDSTQLSLKKKQLQAQIGAVLSRKPDIPSQLGALEEQLKQAEREQRRIASLVKADAAPRKQLDDANAQVAIIRDQITAQRTSLNISSQSIGEESAPLSAQVEQVEDQISKYTIVNTVHGTVLTKYMEAGELATTGKPLYKIADLSSIVLRAYVTGDQFSGIKLHQKVKVLVDEGKDKYREYEGVIEWISDKAEFTPKTIQTKDERANLVYAVKIRLKNDGLLKIGMYGEIKF
jgi:HlyD family secretion protein